MISHWLARTSILVGSYTAWVLAFHLLILTLWTYLGITSSSKLQNISEEIASIEISSAGLCALAFVATLGFLYPISSQSNREIFSLQRIIKRFLPAMLRGLILGSSVTVAFVLAGAYQFFGFVTEIEEFLPFLFSIFLKATTIVLLVYCEEYVFRYKLLNILSLKKRPLHPLVLAGIASTAYCLIKGLQFDLGIMHYTTLFLISMILSVKFLAEREHADGAGYWAGILIAFHCLYGLPILGNNFSGALIFRYEASGGTLAALDPRTSLFLTGGIGGPLSSFVFQVILLFQFFLLLLKTKRTYPLLSGRRPLR